MWKNMKTTHRQQEYMMTHCKENKESAPLYITHEVQNQTKS